MIFFGHIQDEIKQANLVGAFKEPSNTGSPLGLQCGDADDVPRGLQCGEAVDVPRGLQCGEAVDVLRGL